MASYRIVTKSRRVHCPTDAPVTYTSPFEPTTIAVASSLPGVKKLLMLVEKNPSLLSASFDVTDAVEPNFGARVKMGQSSDVYAVAIMGDGKTLFARKEVKVTLGGCGG